MPDRYVGVLLNNGSKLSVEAYNTESSFLCITHANDKVRWTIVSIRTGATFGAFKTINDAQNIVKILIDYGLDRVDKIVRGKEWDRYHINPEVKQWILNLTRDNL